MTNYVVVTSDDLQPLTLHLFDQYWKPLKEKHPDLRVTFFVAPFNREVGQGSENDISFSEKFKQWYRENKNWCEVEIHGLDHTKPPENQRSYEEQKEIIESAVGALWDYVDPSCIGYKAPFYREDENTLKILNELGFAWHSQWWTLIPLKTINKKMPQILEIGTHTNMPSLKNPDNIDVFYEQLDHHLTFLKQRGFKIVTLRDIMKEVMQ